MKKRINNPRGFTLVELMITLVISGIISAVLYATYLAQQRSYTAQEAVAEMQQNLRAAMMLMTRDIRMAGYDPNENSGATIKSASVNQLHFTMDLNADGDTLDTNEDIIYGFSTANDGNADGIADAGFAGLGRDTNTGGGFQSIAENIQAIEFQYLDAAGNILPLTGTPPQVSSPDNIRAVRVSILARASRPDRKFTNTKVYTPASGTPWDLNGAAAGNAPNDNFRRRLLITTIQCRNMGL